MYKLYLQSKIKFSSFAEEFLPISNVTEIFLVALAMKCMKVVSVVGNAFITIP
jgi:hypothetical protein